MSEAFPGQLDQLQEDVAVRLQTAVELAGIEVFHELTNDKIARIEITVGKIKGICIIVTPPIASVSKPNMPGPYLDVNLEINIPESPILNNGANGTKKSAGYVAEICARRLHRFITRDGRCLIVTKIMPVADPELRVYRVSIVSAFGLHDKKGTTV